MEPQRTSPAPAPSSSFQSPINGELSGAASTSSSSSPVREETATAEWHEEDRAPQMFPERSTVFYNVEYPTTTTEYEEPSLLIREDNWSCAIVLLTFWFFVAMTLILGVFGSVNLQLGPNSSILIEPNPLFVERIKVEQINEAKSGPVLYGLYRTPTLDVVKTWSENRSTSLQPGTYKEWMYVLNERSQINISYSVTSSSSSSLILIVAQGSASFAEWIVDPSYPNGTLSWHDIHGSGFIQQDIPRSSTYYVAVGNLNSEEVDVYLNLRVKGSLYDTTEAYYKCTAAHSSCSLKLIFPRGNAAVLTSPDLEQGSSDDYWYVRLSYGPRWITYVVGIGGMTLLMLLALHFLNKYHCSHLNRTAQYREVGSERAPLLSRKDSDLSSWGSSYDSVSDDDEDLEEGLAAGSLEGKTLKGGEYSNNVRRLCAICFDAPRDCFFLPCGHCVSCFRCGTRIAELAGTCPICHRNMKKVRKIFTV